MSHSELGVALRFAADVVRHAHRQRFGELSWAPTLAVATVGHFEAGSGFFWGKEY
jgi:hypothetical protein